MEVGSRVAADTVIGIVFAIALPTTCAWPVHSTLVPKPDAAMSQWLERCVNS